MPLFVLVIFHQGDREFGAGKSKLMRLNLVVQRRNQQPVNLLPVRLLVPGEHLQIHRTAFFVELEFDDGFIIQKPLIFLLLLLQNLQNFLIGDVNLHLII